MRGSVKGWLRVGLGATIFFYASMAGGQTSYGTDVPQIGTQPGTGGTCTCPDGTPGTWSTAYGDMDGGLQSGQCICPGNPDAGVGGTGLNAQDAGINLNAQDAGMGNTTIYGETDGGFADSGIGGDAAGVTPIIPGSPGTP